MDKIIRLLSFPLACRRRCFCLTVFILATAIAGNSSAGPGSLAAQACRWILVAFTTSGPQGLVCQVSTRFANTGLQMTQECSLIFREECSVAFLQNLARRPEQVIRSGRDYDYWTYTVDIAGNTIAELYQEESSAEDDLVILYPAQTVPPLSLMHYPATFSQLHNSRVSGSHALNPLPWSLGMPGQAASAYRLISPVTPVLSAPPVRFSSVWNNPGRPGEMQIIFNPFDLGDSSAPPACQGGFDRRTGLPRCLGNPAFGNNRVIGFFTGGEFSGMLFPSISGPGQYWFFHTLCHLMKILGVNSSSCAAEVKKEMGPRDPFDDNDQSGPSSVLE